MESFDEALRASSPFAALSADDKSIGRKYTSLNIMYHGKGVKSMYPKSYRALCEVARQNRIKTAVKWARRGDLQSAARALVFAGLSKQEALNLCIYWWKLDKADEGQDERVSEQMRQFRERMGW